MQFKHPEILWALLLLLIPIFIHLFQLRRFKIEPFTNVAMLKKVISESRKSSTLKKWLLLFSRIALITAFVIAFAQPFSSSEKALKPMETVIYLDNSFSMQAKSEGVPLLKKAVQNLIQNIDSDAIFSLFTNDRVFRKVTLSDVQNELLTLPYSQNQYSISDIRLKAKTLFSKSDEQTKRVLLFSDFQNRIAGSALVEDVETHFVQLQPDDSRNVAIDSVYLDGISTGQNTLFVMLSGVIDESIPISLYDTDKLIAKTSATFGERGVAKVEFTLSEKSAIDGRLVINDPVLAYDNNFFFTINNSEIIKVLVISEGDVTYLKKLFREDEFDLVTTTLPKLNYSLIEQQNLVVIDNLESIPESLKRTLRNFHDTGGSLVIIPSKKIEPQSYNALLQSLGKVQLKDFITNEQNISQINFEHPLYQNVFEKRVTNFQNPKVTAYYKIDSYLPKLLSYSSGEPFLIGENRFYLFSAPLETENSNFKSAPLIVPTFYNMAQFSLKNPELYFTVNSTSQTDIGISLSKDDIVRLTKEDVEIIPQQQSFKNKVRLFFDDNPQEEGIFSIQIRDSTYKKVGFNYNRNESKLQYADMANFTTMNEKASIASLFDFIKSENSIAAYWKWFVILALIFALVEALIQKFIA